MRLVTIANQKGGCGKTTTTLALAQAAVSKGYKVLAIDLDSQANLSMTLKAKDGNSAYDLLTGSRSARECIQQTEGGIDLVPAVYDLCTIKTEKGSARRLQVALEPIKAEYDFIFLDTPPNVGEMQYNALQASTDLIITAEAALYDLEGLFTVYDTAMMMKKTNKDLSIRGYILTNHNGRSKLVKSITNTIQKQATEMGLPFLGAIRQGIAIREAQALKVSLYEYAPKSNPALDYLEVFKALEN